MYHIGDILDELQIEYVLRGEGTFEVLGLLASRTDKKLCSFVMSRKFVGDVPENVSVLLTNEETAPACGANCCIVDETALRSRSCSRPSRPGWARSRSSSTTRGSRATTC